MAKTIKKTPAPIDLNAEQPPGADQSGPAPVVEKMPGRPICPYCQVPMVAAGSPNLFTYYKCPSGTACGAAAPPFRTKVPRTDAIRRLRADQRQTPEHGPPR